RLQAAFGLLSSTFSFFHAPATTDLYTLSLHDALPIYAGVLLARALGSSVAPDGFSAPYRITMAVATAIYGFLGLLLAFRLARQRSEEHTSELQSLRHLVCRLLLEKKKNIS